MAKAAHWPGTDAEVRKRGEHIDAELGLIYLRVPTWCPFRLQFYCNGHSWLARQLTAAGIVKGGTVRGLNFFNRAEQTLLTALQRPAFNIAGLRRADLLPLLARCSPATLTRHLARLRQLGVIKRVTGTYRYYRTRAGRAAIAAGRRLTEHTIIPALA